MPLRKFVSNSVYGRNAFFCYEPYLNIIKDKHKLSLLSRFRISSHQLKLKCTPQRGVPNATLNHNMTPYFSVLLLVISFNVSNVTSTFGGSIWQVDYVCAQYTFKCIVLILVLIPNIHPSPLPAPLP
jgi:hypothetical protein